MATRTNVIQPDNATVYELAVSPNGTGKPTKRGAMDEAGVEGTNAFYGHVSEAYVSELEWPHVYKIYNEMSRRDPTIRSVILSTKLFAQQADWKAESPTDKPADRQAKEFLESCLVDMSHTFGDFIDDVLSFLPLSWSSFEVCNKWRSGTQGQTKSLFDDGLIGWEKFAFRRQSSFVRWEIDDKGQFLGWWQNAAPNYVETFLPANHLLHFVAERDGNNPEGRALLESIYEPWHFVKNLQIINGIGWQRTFVGLPVFEAEQVLSVQDKAAIKSVGEGLTVDEKQYVSVPQGIKFRLESTNNAGAGSLLDTIKMYRALMLQTFLAEFMMQGLLGVGSYSSQADKSTLYIMAVNGWLNKIADVINRQAVPKLFEFEANKIQGITELPKIIHSDIRKPNLVELGQYIQQVAQYVRWGDEDALWLRQQSGMLETLPENPDQPPAPLDTPPAQDNPPTNDNQPVTGDGTDQPQPDQNMGEFHEGQPIAALCPFCGGHKVTIFKEHGDLCLCEDCQMSYDHEYHYGYRYGA